MENRVYYYARVSTKEQNLDRQIAAFVAMGAEEREIITDKESGKSLDQPGYHIRPGHLRCPHDPHGVVLVPLSFRCSSCTSLI